MNDFEHLLQRRQLRRVPPEWRGEILNAARQSKPEDQPSQLPWWLGWLRPSPIAWAGVACAWLLVLGLNVASRPSASEIAGFPPVSMEGIATALLQQRQLVQELSRSENEPATPPRKRHAPGACNWRAPQNGIA